MKQNDEETFNLQGSFPNLLQNTPEKIKYDAVTCTLNLFEAEPRAIGHRQLRKVQSSSHDLDMVLERSERHNKTIRHRVFSYIDTYVLKSLYLK